MSTETNLPPDHPVRRFLDPHLHPSGLPENRIALIAPEHLPMRNIDPERMVRKKCGCSSRT